MLEITYIYIYIYKPCTIIYIHLATSKPCHRPIAKGMISLPLWGQCGHQREDGRRIFVDPPCPESSWTLALCTGGLPGDGRLDDGWCITGGAVPGLQKEQRKVILEYIFNDIKNMMSSLPSPSDSLLQVFFTSLRIFGMYTLIFAIGP